MYVSSYCCICVLIGEHNRSVHLQLYSNDASLDRRCSRSHGHKLCFQLGRQLLVFDNCNATVGREQQGGVVAAPDCAGRGELALGPYGGAEGVRRHRDLWMKHHVPPEIMKEPLSPVLEIQKKKIC
jgi:hypothetical protein